jgi:hypothetical protein
MVPNIRPSPEEALLEFDFYMGLLEGETNFDNGVFLGSEIKAGTVDNIGEESGDSTFLETTAVETIIEETTERAQFGVGGGRRYDIAKDSVPEWLMKYEHCWNVNLVVEYNS